MRNCLLLGLGLLLMGTVASAYDFTTADGPTYQGTWDSRSPVTITQNLDITTIEAVQVACGVSGVSTTQNWYLRRFFLYGDHGITDPLDIQSVDFGVQQLQMSDASPPPPYDIELKLFEIGNGLDFLFGNMNMVASETVTINESDIGTIINVPITWTVVFPEVTDLVVAIDAPDGAAIGAGLQFRPGANTAGALQDAYIAAADCGITEPTGVTAIGFPDSQTIFVVNGESGPPTPAEQTSWGQVKAIYR